MPRVLTKIARVVKSGTRNLATAISSFPSDSAFESKPKTQQNKHEKKYQVTTRLSDKLNKLAHDSIAKGEPHFRIGGKKLFFPTARVILLRPNAKHTPYQAKFIVPKSFNRMDLRDYLYNFYGLRAFNITTQLLHGKYTRDGNAIGRYRQGQIKKMTIDMLEPFVWPEEPANKDQWNVKFFNELATYAEEHQRLGSDKFKPGTAFDGTLGPYKHKPEPFIPRQLKRQLINQKTKAKAKEMKADDIELVTKYLDL